MATKAVFIDRDGTLNIDHGYIDTPEELQLYPGVPEGIQLLKENGFLIIVVTNQSGIGRGFFCHETVGKIHEKLRQDLSKKGANIDAIYYCPHHPDDDCDCRKPKTGMMEQAIHDFDIDITSSFIIGDRASDIQAGLAMGCSTLLISHDQKQRLEREETSSSDPDYIVDTFYKGVLKIIKHTS